MFDSLAPSLALGPSALSVGGTEYQSGVPHVPQFIGRSLRTRRRTESGSEVESAEFETERRREEHSKRGKERRKAGG